MNKAVSTVLFLILVLSLGHYLSAQQNPPAPQAPVNPDRFEEAHQGIFAPKTSPADAAVRYTNAVADSLQAGSPSAGPIPRKNYIDEHIFGRIERDKIPHAGLASDEEFVRRVYLDAAGMIPTAKQVRDFVASKDMAKRDKLIDALIGTEQFVEQFAWFWGDLFMIGGHSSWGRDVFHQWNKEWLRVDRPYNDVVFDLLTPSGKAHNVVPALGFIARANDRVDFLPADADDFRVTNRLDVLDILSIQSGRIFLGINKTCVSCHDGARHLESVNLYLSQRTREEFHNDAAFFGRLRSLATYFSNDDQVIDDLAPGYDSRSDAPFITPSMNSYPRDRRMHEPAFLLTGEKPRAGTDHRSEYARMLTGNIQFARATANLLWGRLMTVGFVEPYDGFDLARIDPKNPPPQPWSLQPTNPELLDAMALDFQKNNYSIQSVIRTIMKSSAYQLSSRFPAEWNDSYTPYYARKYIRFMTGPEVADAVATATDQPPSFTLRGEALTRVKQLTYPGDASSGGVNKGDKGTDMASLFQAFFQGTRWQQSPNGNYPTTLQALMMTNLDFVNKRVQAEKGSRVEQLLKSGISDNELIEELFLTTLARWPTPAEREVTLQALERDRRHGAENILWALLNNMEFVLNH
jgi:hypothetical protein